MEWWQQNWGNIANAVGLVLSILALLRAQHASRAARRALAMQYQRTLAQELRACSERVMGLAKLCRSGDWNRARDESDEIIQRITVAQNRWADQLVDEVSKDELNLVVEQLGAVGGQVTRLASSTTGGHADAVDRVLNLITRRLAAEVGKHERAVDELT
jgi:hypothetical protein